MSALCAGGIVRHGALCYTARRICAAHRAAMTAKNFRTRAAAKRRGISFAPQKYFFMQSAQGIPTQGFQNHIPARGRKRLNTPLSKNNIYYFKTISPQGDGNSERFSQSCLFCTFQNHIPARGRKLAPPKLISVFVGIFQNHIPARGRKHCIRDVGCHIT